MISKKEVMDVLNEKMGDNLTLTSFSLSSKEPQATMTYTSTNYLPDSSSGLNDLLSVSGNTMTNTFFNRPLSGWGYYQDYYYPYIIKESYPVYLQERAQDKGKQAFEIIKALQDKKLMKLDKVSDFIEAMDTLIKTL